MRKTLLLLFTLLISVYSIHAQFIIDTVSAPNCDSVCTGHAHVSPEIAGYSYEWSGGFMGPQGSGLCAGPVYCVVRDAGNVIVDTAFGTIPDPVPFGPILITSTNNSCSPPYNGDITIHALGGVPGYTYMWSGGYTSQDSVRPMLTGAYVISVFDATGCRRLAFLEIQPFAMQPWAQSIQPATNCTTYDGGISVGVQGGGYPYSFVWSDGNTEQFNSSLHAGSHSVTITDVLNCSVIYTDSVPYGPILTGELLVEAACNGAPVGFLSAYQLQSNHHPLAFQWSTGDTSVSIQSALPGEYILTVTDGMGCRQVITDTVFSGNLLVDTAFVNATSCFSGDGIGFANVVEGTEPVNCGWYNISTMADYGLGDTIYNLQQGNYSLYVEDAIGCNTYITFTITGHLEVTHSETPITCQNPTGSSTFNLQANANGYMINWGDSSADEYISISVVTATHNYTTAGNYRVYVADMQGFCSDTIAITINNQGAVIDTTVLEYPGCLHPGGGQISVSASGPAGPYLYSWNNGNTTNTIMQLPAGIYALTVTDNTGCQTERTFTLPEVNSFSYYALALANATACNGNDGVASISPYGGNPPYTYMWNTSPVQTNDTATGLSAGTYYVTVTDSLGCTTTGHINVGDGCMPQITGVLYVDSNNNCLLDSTDEPIAQVLVIATRNGQAYYGTTNNSGYYSITVPDTGNYLVNTNYLANGLCLSPACNSSAQVVDINFMGNTYAGNDFVYSFDNGTPASNVFVHPGWTSSIPGSTKDFWIFAFGAGSVINSSYTYTFVFDSALTFVSSDVPYTIYNPATRTLVWTNTPLTYIGRIHFVVNANTPLNYLMENYFSVTPLGNECYTLDNILHTSERVTGSRDPNSKEVQPAGPLTDADSVLVYTIHFQNTGNDTTWFINL
ncbi:MAG TPA: hypothetical protein VK174_10705, partial [Chitinophagales bacterium]|nr:hypothetical protein [Chitinophagales bacterium]